MRRLLCLFLVLLMTVMVSGCGLMDWIFPDRDNTNGPDDDDDYIELPGDDDDTIGGTGRPTTLWVADAQANYIVPVTFNVEWEEGIAQAVVRHLVEGGPAQQFLATNGMKAVLPAGTEIRGMTIKETGECIVDFNEKFLDTVDEVHEQLILDSVIKTLTEFSAIESVTIWVNGVPLTRMTHGTIVEMINSRQRAVNAAASPKGTGAMVTVYMRMDSLAGGALLVPVSRPVASAADLARAALEQLIGGPAANSDLSGVMPASTRILELSRTGDTVMVDFSSDLNETDDINFTVAAIVLTLTELPNVKQVKLTVDGEDIHLSDGQVLSEPVFRPSSTNPLAF